MLSNDYLLVWQCVPVELFDLLPPPVLDHHDVLPRLLGEPGLARRSPRPGPAHLHHHLALLIAPEIVLHKDDMHFYP